MHAEWQTIPELIRDRARKAPSRLGVEVDGRALSYADIDALSDRVASALAAQGLTKGAHVASMAYNCIEQLLIWFGTMKLGAIWIPLNVGLRGQDLAFCLADCAPSLVVVDEECHPELKAVVNPAIPLFRIAPKFPLSSGEAPFEALLAASPAPPQVEIGPRDPAVVIYTGGTTGMPKGVVLPQFAWIAAGYRYIEAFGATESDAHYSVCPMFHNSGLMLGIIGPYVAGIPTHLERWFSVSRFWERVRGCGATIIDPIGTMVTLLCQQPPSDLDRAHKVRVSIGVLTQVPEGVGDTFRNRFGIETVNVYSLSESGGVLIIHNGPRSHKPEANGNGGDRCDIAIFDENDRRLPAGQIGEICLRPKHAYTFMLGYLNAPERTVECWRNLWLHTGDLGYIDDEGYLYFVGRHAHWLRVSGENVSAYEIENILSGYPDLTEVIVIGVPADLGEDCVKAFIRSPSKVDPSALYDWAVGKMAAFKLPRYIQQVDEFPRSVTKREVERYKLRDMPHSAAWDAQLVYGRSRHRSSQAKR